MGDWLHKRGIIKEVGILKIMKARFLSEKEITNKQGGECHNELCDAGLESERAA